MAENNRIVISSNEKRNMAQVVYINTLPCGRKESITRHEALVSDKPANPYRRAFPKAAKR